MCVYVCMYAHTHTVLYSSSHTAACRHWSRTLTARAAARALLAGEAVESHSASGSVCGSVSAAVYTVLSIVYSY